MPTDVAPFVPSLKESETADSSAYQSAYYAYLAAFNRLTDLMSQGKGGTPEAEEAYGAYQRLRERLHNTPHPDGQPDAPPLSPEELNRLYAAYQAAYQQLTNLADQGKGETMEAKIAYEVYVNAKREYEAAIRRTR